MKRKKQTAIRDQMLQFSKLQLTELNREELASLMLALPAKHPLFFNAWAEVERRKMAAFEKLPDELKAESIAFMQHLEQEHSEIFDGLARVADYTRADMLINHLSEKRGRLN